MCSANYPFQTCTTPDESLMIESRGYAPALIVTERFYSTSGLHVWSKTYTEPLPISLCPFPRQPACTVHQVTVGTRSI